jgi:glutathione S-transferase
MDAILYGIPGSHPVKAAELMLEHKGVDFERVDLAPGEHWEFLPSHGFPGRTVPALALDGSRVQGSRRISRALEELRPEPRLFPEEPSARTMVEEAERFGEEALQPLARRLVLAAAARDLSSLAADGEDGGLGAILAPDADRRAAIAQAAAKLVFGVTEDSEREDLAALPHMLERIEGWLEIGALGGRNPNAADCQILPSLWLLMYRNDLRPQIQSRAAGAFAAERTST